MKRTLSLSLATVLAACGARHEEHPITDVRTTDRTMRLDVSDSERFGLRDPSAPTDAGAQREQRLEFELPDGWERVPRGSMREVDLRAPGGVAVWVTRLRGDGGGEVPNLNRWRAEMGLERAGQGEFDALPTITLLGGEGRLFDAASADGSKRQLIAFRIAAAGSVFVKMVGSPDAVAAQVDAFTRFYGSLREASADAAPVIAHTRPSGWRPLPSDPLRQLHFDAGAGVTCWVTVLSGDGGGLEANIERWYRQAGLDPPDADAIAALPRVAVRGTEGTFVDLVTTDGEQALLAVSAFTDGEAWFVKMAGPAEAVAARREAFLAFSASLGGGSR